MKSLQDALYNWLSIKVVHDARPDDHAAKETVHTFYQILEKDYQINSIQVEAQEELYYVHYDQNGTQGKYRFPRELIDCILDSINVNPERYKNFE